MAWPSLALLLLGVVLRIWRPGEQVALGDEISAIPHDVIHWSPAMILAKHNGLVALNAPLMLWEWLLMRGAGLDE
jgi:hypothetical protein